MKVFSHSLDLEVESWLSKYRKYNHQLRRDSKKAEKGREGEGVTVVASCAAMESAVIAVTNQIRIAKSEKSKNFSRDQ